MSESKHVIKIKIINWIAEKQVERVMKVQSLTEEEKEKLYLDTFNELQEILKDFG